MDTKEIRKQSDKELAKLLDEKREALRRFRFDRTGSRVKNMREGNIHRRTIARILTEQKSRSRATS